MKKVWMIWKIMFLIGGAMILGSAYFSRVPNLFWLTLITGVALATAGLWLPWAWHVLKSHYWWLTPVVWGVGEVVMAMTGHLWALVALFAIGTVTLIALLLWLPHDLAKLRKAMQAEQPDGRRNAH